MLPMLRSRSLTPTLFEPSLEPWSELRREFDRLFDSVLSGMGSNDVGGTPWVPAMDVEDHDDRLRLSFELPGVKPEDLEVTVEGGVLTVTGEKKAEAESNGRLGVRSWERRYGRFRRSMALPSYVDADHIAANYEHGVLTIDLPRTAESRRRKIEIGRGSAPKQLESSDSGARRAA